MAIMSKKMMLLLVICLSVTGCISNRITQYYDFTGQEVSVDQRDMVVGARLVGEITPGEKEGWCRVSKSSAPYALIIYVVSKTGFYQYARIADIQLMDAQNRTVKVPDSVTGAIVKFSENMARYHVELPVNDLYLAYERHVLIATVDITTRANSIIKQNIHFQFEPVYREEKTNDTWERLKKD